MMTTKQMNLMFGSFSLIILASSIHIVDAQFFTKSSKSIPRMGRRSDNSMAASQYRHQLIDSLVDEYGPHFVAALEGKSLEAPKDQGELVLQNEQPFDNHLKRRIPDIFAQLSPPRQYADDQSGYEQLAPPDQATRDERSPRPSYYSSNGRDASLAMRALNLSRLMQHLASGGQPLMSYDRLFSGQVSGGENGNNGDLGGLSGRSFGQSSKPQRQSLQLED